MLCGFTPFWDSGSPVRIYENILKGKVKYPPYLHDDAVSPSDWVTCTEVPTT
jgi:protein kinase A